MTVGFPSRDGGVSVVNFQQAGRVGGQLCVAIWADQLAIKALFCLSTDCSLAIGSLEQKCTNSLDVLISGRFGQSIARHPLYRRELHANKWIITFQESVGGSNFSMQWSLLSFVWQMGTENCNARELLKLDVQCVKLLRRTLVLPAFVNWNGPWHESCTCGTCALGNFRNAVASTFGQPNVWKFASYVPLLGG